MQEPNLLLSDAEAAMLAKAGSNVARWYAPLDMDADTKANAWLALCICLGVVYVPKIRAISIERKAAREAALQAQEQPLQ